MTVYVRTVLDTAKLSSFVAQQHFLQKIYNVATVTTVLTCQHLVQ